MVLKQKKIDAVIEELARLQGHELNDGRYSEAGRQRG